MGTVGTAPWAASTLGALCEFENGDRSLNYPSPGSFVAMGAPFVNAGHLHSGRINLDDMDYITDAMFTRLGSGKFGAGDILFCLRGSLGKFGIVDSSVPNGAIASSLVIIRPRRQKITVEFLMAYLASELCAQEIEKWAGGAAQPNLGARDLSRFLIPLPPLSEQIRIANSVASADLLIRSLERLIAKKLAIKHGMMQQLLTGRVRLAGFSGPWTSACIKDIVSSPVTDGPHMTPKFHHTGVPFLSVNNLVDGKINWSDLRYISKEDDELFSRKCKPQRGDVLLGKAASVGKVAYVEDDTDMNIWSPIALIRPKPSITSKFVYYQLQSIDSVRQIDVLTNSSSQGNIGMNDIEKVTLKLPEMGEQAAIVHVLDDVTAELEAWSKRLDAMRLVKQGMVQELLTGRTRLIPVEVAA